MATRQPQAAEGTPTCTVATPTLKEYITKYLRECVVRYRRNQAHDHDQKTCKWYGKDKAALAGANQDRKLKSERQRPPGIRVVQAELQKMVGPKEALEKMLTSKNSPKEEIR